MKRRLLSLIGAVALAALPADYIKNKPIKNTPNLEAKIINPSFTEAKKYPNLRQKYLDNLLNNSSKYIEAKDCIERIIYDPKFLIRNKEDSHLRKTSEINNRYLNDAGYGEGKKGEENQGLMCVPISKERVGKKARIHVGELAFEFLDCEDDLLSGLDNEAFSARGLYTNIFEINVLRPDPKVGLPSRAYLNLEREILSFDLQFSNIEKGKRKISKKLLIGAISPATKLMIKLQEISMTNSIDSHYAIGLIATLEKRPTIKYFKARTF